MPTGSCDCDRNEPDLVACRHELQESGLSCQVKSKEDLKHITLVRQNITKRCRKPIGCKEPRSTPFSGGEEGLFSEGFIKVLNTVVIFAVHCSSTVTLLLLMYFLLLFFGESNSFFELCFLYLCYNSLILLYLENQSSFL